MHTPRNCRRGHQICRLTLRAPVCNGWVVTPRLPSDESRVSDRIEFHFGLISQRRQKAETAILQITNQLPSEDHRRSSKPDGWGTVL
jgi:hypothetical protein